jgi:hypothetical protein
MQDIRDQIDHYIKTNGDYLVFVASSNVFSEDGSMMVL